MAHPDIHHDTALLRVADPAILADIMVVLADSVVQVDAHTVLGHGTSAIANFLGQKAAIRVIVVLD